MRQETGARDSEEEITAAVVAADPRVVAVFAAGCAERVIQQFTSSRGGDPDRADDVEVLVDAVERLWDLAASAESFGATVPLLEAFRELHGEDVLVDTEDIIAFEAVVTALHATQYRATGDPTAALACAHVIRTAMWMFDQNSPGSDRHGAEVARQREVLASGAVPAALVRAQDIAIGREWALE
ncbi:hypothetical protein [Actinokineospora globicatena]|uniref:hypothetical protein n=1 Tax=Actinokineospora globicatena TaxID=103729 RepID=UPI0025543A4E|nr:hypothetical protein [Actinokineospora globicatena]